MLAQIGWTFLLYAWLTIARAQAVKRGEVDYGAFARGEEPHAWRASRAICQTSSSCR
jgi:hypothetical protein